MLVLIARCHTDREQLLSLCFPFVIARSIYQSKTAQSAKTVQRKTQSLQQVAKQCVKDIVIVTVCLWLSWYTLLSYFRKVTWGGRRNKRHRKWFSFYAFYINCSKSQDVVIYKQKNFLSLHLHFCNVIAMPLTQLVIADAPIISASALTLRRFSKQHHHLNSLRPR